MSLELKQVLSDIYENQNRIESHVRISNERGLGDKSIFAKLALDRAEQAFKQKNWLTALSESQSYLNLEQKPETNKWLHAQFILARSYEERGQPARAARAYLRYLSTYITAPNDRHDQLIDAIEHLVLVGTKGNGKTKAELNQFLSSIAAMKLPHELANELKYFSAVGSSNIGQQKMASSWLQDIAADDPNPNSKARSKLFRAMIAVQENRYEDAEQELQGLLTSDKINQKSVDTARLILARVYLRMKKTKTAIKIYDSIAPTSELFRDSLYEKLVANIRNNNAKISLQLAQNFLEKFPTDANANQVRSIKSWLEIQSGDIESAKASIAANSKNLEDIRGKVSTSMTGRTRLSEMDLSLLVSITNSEVNSPADLESILNMFNQISDLNFRAAESLGTTLNILYAIASVDLRAYHPYIANRIDQVEKLIGSHISIGEKL
ncbi:MAG: tetratricopeptide repeat protein, partial [Proteobacteria bacterium]|nr:tetratricopeptide repeat protein [Pseudomonadota bacterium]